MFQGVPGLAVLVQAPALTLPFLGEGLTDLGLPFSE
jgi:hypothetical protein